MNIYLILITTVQGTTYVHSGYKKEKTAESVANFYKSIKVNASVQMIKVD